MPVFSMYGSVTVCMNASMHLCIYVYMYYVCM